MPPGPDDRSILDKAFQGVRHLQNSLIQCWHTPTSLRMINWHTDADYHTASLCYIVMLDNTADFASTHDSLFQIRSDVHIAFALL